MRILVTGGAGYIGSHTVVALAGAGHSVTVVDDLSNGSPVAVERAAELGGRPVALHVVDLLDLPAVDEVVARTRPQAVLHFAGRKAVGESVEQPLEYYRTNVSGTVELLRTLARHDCRTVVFSSSATVYGTSTAVPFTEDAPVGATNPYGWSKVMAERVLTDAAAADPRWRVALLRYFNPVGAHPSGRIGEDPDGVPNNLVPYIAQVAVGRRDRLTVHGDDYDTPDGTGVRDYLHVMDLAAGHVAALDALATRSGCHVWNLGTGRGHSVLDVVRAFAQASGREIPHTVAGRRPGDVAVSYADPTRARTELGWTATRDLAAMCVDTWRWQSRNPHGYPRPA